jgi:sensor histidine kinase YesM
MNDLQKPAISFKERISAITGNLFLVIVLIFISIGQVRTTVSRNDAILPFLSVEIPVFTLMFMAATFWNIYRLIPRLLLRGRYVLYVSILFAMAFIFVLAEVLSEWTMISIHQLPPGDYGFFAKDGIFVLDFLSDFICYFISLVGTSLIVFLRRWWKSGERIRELEQTGVRVELEKARTKIDSGALFDILDKAASIAVAVPREAARMLMELSKSLRRQLYESEHKQVFPALTEKTTHSFREQDRLLNFLIEKRHRVARNLLMVIAVCLIGSANLNPHNPFSIVEFATLVGAFLALGYINIYVLLPRFLFKNRLAAYFISVFLIIIVFILLMVSSDYKEELGSFWGISIISSTTQIAFVFAGTAAIVLFQHWARNERRIAELEAATMQAELEQLQNQINPHFLFNMLNNILVLIRENTEEAVVILHKMSDMLKYQFNAGAKREVRLSDDIHFLTDFLNLENIRRDRFEFTISADDETKAKSVPPLLFIPFVENAVKHSADAVNLSYIRLNFSATGDTLHFTCLNSKPLNPRRKNEFSGIGLANIKRRLELLYDGNYALHISEDETSYKVELKIENGKQK